MNSPNVDMASNKRSLLRQEVENLDEQRRYPRVPLNIKSAFVTDTGSTFSIEVINISPDGLQVRCSVDNAHFIRPQGSKPNPLNAPCISAAIALPVGHGSRTLGLRCQMLYLKMIDTELGCIAGFRFVQLDLRSERILNAFFADHLMHEGTDGQVA